MGDLISRSALIEQLKQYKSEWKLAEPFHEGIASGLKIAIEVTEKQLTVEAKPVVKGEWIEEKGVLDFFYSCSECNSSSEYKTNFCKTCGADMRKKVQDE